VRAGRIDPQAFRDAFLCWVQAALPSLSGEQLCLDGKTLRGSRSGDKAVAFVECVCGQSALGAGAAGGGRKNQ